jgi:putative ABC transport system substrate-binding protein
MRRRDFITMIAGSATAWSLAARAQEAGRTYQIGVVTGALHDAPHFAAFFDELRSLGFVDGQNLQVLPGSFGLSNEQMAGAAVVFAKSSADLVICVGDATILAARQANPNMPIIGISNDLVGRGLVQSLARPGGNTTGISILANDLDGKRQDILIEAVPGAKRMAALADPSVTTQERLHALQDAVRGRGVELATFTAATPADIAPAIKAAKASGAAGLNVLAAPLFSVSRRILLGEAAQLRLPAIYEWPDMAEDGGLIGYGPRRPAINRLAAHQVAKVLQGVKPADIPVEQPTRFELVINLQTAKVIGHDVPANLVARADKVIE